jgi:predicted GH43/DUF377 family glycosyl hydrolase
MDTRVFARARIVTAAATAILLSSGCGQGAVPAASPAGGTAASSPAATPRITPTPAPAVTQRFTFARDAVVDTKLAGTTDLYINPGALIEADGLLHLFPNSFSAWPGRMRIPHLTSTDSGVTWTLDRKTVPIDSKDFPLADPGMDVSTGFVTDDGKWVLIYETVSTSKAWVIARATAPSPTGPWTIEDKPILEPGRAGAFDNGGVQWPWVLRVGNRWAMYYAGFDSRENGNGSIGIAFSDDGRTWVKNDAPVMVASGKWEGRSLDRPRVVHAPGGYVMVYAGRTLTDRGLATSPDGLTWTRVPGPNIQRKDFPVREPGSWDSALLSRDGELDYFLEIGGETTKIYRATLAWP